MCLKVEALAITNVKLLSVKDYGLFAFISVCFNFNLVLNAYIVGINEPLKEFTGLCIAIIHRLNDDDDKLIVVPENINPTNKEILEATNFQEQYFISEIIR